MRTKRALVIALVLSALLVLALVGCGSSTAPSSTGTTSGTGGGAATTGGGSTTITEQNFAFSPANVTVKVGDVVTWVNKDSTAHHVKIDNQDLGEQAPGASVTWTAAKAGTYPYSCIIHPSMTGQITVQ